MFSCLPISPSSVQLPHWEKLLVIIQDMFSWWLFNANYKRVALCPAFKIFCSWATVHWGIFAPFLRQSSSKDTELMTWTWDQQGSFGLRAAERMFLHSRQHLPSWCGEPHWAEVAGNPRSCLAASPAAPISHLWASWAVYTPSVRAVAPSPWRWATVLPVLPERHGLCNLLSTECSSPFPFSSCCLQAQEFSQ